jgi:hypothetical protein
MKKTSFIVFTALIFACFAVVPSAMAQAKPVQLSLWNTIQLEDASTSIHGLRLALYGENEDIYGVDFGGLLKINGDMVGWQSGLVNIVEGDVKGVQNGFGHVINFVNMVGGDVWGWQHGAVNMTEGEVVGLQTGLVNFARDLRGVQLSFVNVSNIQKGLQIGLVNINNGGTPYGILPIVNWKF